MKLTKSSTAVGLLLICMLAASVTYAQEIRGHVTEAGSGKSIAGAQLIFRLITNSAMVFGLVTDNDGQYSTDALAESIELGAGHILFVEVSADNYQTKDTQIIVADGWTRKDIRLERIARPQQRVFKLEHRNARDLMQLILPYITDQHNLGIADRFNTITVKELPEQLERIEAVIREHDVPLQQIWVEISLVLASGETGRDPEFPAELADVIGTLGPLFKFDTYEIIGSANAMGIEESSMLFTSGADSAEEVDFQVAVSEIGYNGGIIKLTDISIKVHKPTEKWINTTVNVKDGEMVILGASRGDVAKGSLITLVNARTLN